jgi:drug/metabolite transporter (DMT)-like permease
MRAPSAVRLLVLATLWGSNFLWIKVALRGMSPGLIVVARLALGAAVLVPLVRRRGQRLVDGGFLWRHVFLAAVIGNVAPYLLFATAEQRVSSSLAGMLNATTPLWALTFALALRTQRQTSRRQVAGLIVGLGGAVVVLSPWRSGAAVSALAVVLCLLGAASYGLSYVYMAKFLTNRGVPSLVLSASQLTAATCMAVAILPWARTGDLHLRADATASIIVLGVAGTGLAYVLNYRLIADEGATAASVVTYLLPAVAILLGALVLGESVTVAQLLGIAVVLAGVALTQWSSPMPAPAGDRGGNPRTHGVR